MHEDVVSIEEAFGDLREPHGRMPPMTFGLAILRCIAMNLLRQARIAKGRLRICRVFVCTSDQYLAQLPGW
ncbi:hypothetical protein BWP39_27620 [Paraburkholderia acidicola]|uniref:Uncharacterized protein n=1 Tax=Paraburkholderia acidicola TaxID=1912599 RepID=A0A2A4EQN5_9BURK|nr:hypothetical protein BWP39_27620 [Paraburkholderia acidicola]